MSLGTYATSVAIFDSPRVHVQRIGVSGASGATVALYPSPSRGLYMDEGPAYVYSNAATLVPTDVAAAPRRR